MKITEIKRQAKNPDRVSVFIDGDFWTGMSEGLFLDLKIFQNQEIDQLEKEKIEEMVVEDGAFSYALSALSAKQFSEMQIRERLEKRDYGQDVIEKVIGRCIELDLINDHELAIIISESRKSSGQYGQKIDQRLKTIGISKPIRESVLKEVFQNSDESELAVKALKDSRFKNKKLDLRDQQRALGFLTRNGFSYRAAKAAIDGVALTTEEEVEKNGVEQAVSDLVLKYKEADVLKTGFYQKAFGFLSRKGYHSSVIKPAISQFQDSFSKNRE